MQYSIIVTILSYISLIHGCANDILALRALYSQLGGQHWRKNTGWNATTPCPAYGVTCNTDGCVTALSLDSNNLQGSLPTEIGFLQRLQNFLVRSNAITGTLPSELGMLTQVRTIELQSNQLTGTIPSELFRLPGLTALFLQFNLLSGVIPKVPNTLALLYIQGNCISGSVPESVCLSKTLLVANVSNNNLTCAGCVNSLPVLPCTPSPNCSASALQIGIATAYTSPECPCPHSFTFNGDCSSAQDIVDCGFLSPERCGLETADRLCQTAREALAVPCPSLRCGLLPEPKTEALTQKTTLPLSLILPLAILVPLVLFGIVVATLAVRKKRKDKLKQYIVPHLMMPSSSQEQSTELDLTVGTLNYVDDTGKGRMSLFDVVTNEEYVLSGKILGKGGAGVVYLGMDKRGHLMAVKNIWTNAEVSKEAIIMKELKHKNLVQLKALARSKEGSEYLVMEFMSGGSLSEQIKDFENFNKIQVRKFLHDVLNGVTFLHDNRVVHRDIKPSNILLAADGTAKVADFGMSKFDYDFTNQTGSLVGTIRYLAPEVVAGESATAKADIWAIGLLTIEMATGEKPWPHLVSDVHVCTTLATFAGDAYTLPLGIRDDELIDFLQKCLHARPDKRSSARELLLHPFLTSTTL